MTRDEAGFGLAEALVGLALLALSFGLLGPLLVQSSRLNRNQQTQAALQASARSCLSMVVQKLRTAGWDPRNTGFTAVVQDPSSVVTGDSIEVRADLNADGDTHSDGEDVIIRHIGDRVEWKSSDASTTPYDILGVDLTNDADGDGTAEAMFILDTMPPHRVTVRITAQSRQRDLSTGQFLRYTVQSDVTLRSAL